MGKGIKTDIRTFVTTTSSLNELGEWLESLKVNHCTLPTTSGEYDEDNRFTILLLAL